MSTLFWWLVIKSGAAGRRPGRCPLASTARTRPAISENSLRECVYMVVAVYGALHAVYTLFLHALFRASLEDISPRPLASIIMKGEVRMERTCHFDGWITCHPDPTIPREAGQSPPRAYSALSARPACSLSSSPEYIVYSMDDGVHLLNTSGSLTSRIL